MSNETPISSIISGAAASLRAKAASRRAHNRLRAELIRYATPPTALGEMHAIVNRHAAQKAAEGAAPMDDFRAAS